MINVAIPRAMSYYYLYPFFKTLLSDLGANVVASRATTKATMQDMASCPTDEPCVAVKLYFAHVKQLLEEEYEFIFLPKIISVEQGSFCCPKFTGVPDMVRNTFDINDRILSPVINISDRHRMLEDISLVAKKLGVRRNIPKIISHAWKAHEDILRLMVENQLTVEEAYGIFDGRTVSGFSPPQQNDNRPSIGLIGHPYVLYEWVSHNLIGRFRKQCKVITPEMVDIRYIKEHLSHIYEGNKIWSFEGQMLGAALHLMKNRLIDRVVLVGLFECGPESIIEAYIEEEADKLGIPLLKLFMDEQTGEAGLVTRIEAFMDTSAEETAKQEEKIDTAVKIPGNTCKEPVVGFPSMGHLDIALSSILQECGVRIIKPPPLSRRSIDLGKELSPEFICLPMTATLGQMLQILSSGADHILMTGGKGQCRLGWYAQIQEMLLKRKGLSFKMVILDTPFPLKENGIRFINSLKEFTAGARFDKIIKSVLFGYHKLKILDEAEGLCRWLRAFEKRRGEADRIFNSFKHKMDLAGSYQSVSKIHREYMESFKAVKTEDTDPLIVRLVGEIWVLLEPYINMEIEKFLGSRDNIRVLVEKEVSGSCWLQGNVLHTRKAMARIKAIKDSASTYLTEPVGGHGLDSVGLTVLASEEGVDGVIHMMPFTCMPEIIAHSIITQMSDKLNIPVLSIIVSDQTGEAGIETRLDAFLDLLLERRFEKRYKME